MTGKQEVIPANPIPAITSDLPTTRSESSCVTDFGLD